MGIGDKNMRKKRIAICMLTLLCALTVSVRSLHAYADEIVPDKYEVAYYAGESDFSVYLDNEGGLYTSGSNGNGQLGRGSASTDARIVPMKVLDNIAQAATGKTGFAVALGKNGTVYTWGNNKYGQLGTGTGFSDDDVYSAVPTPVSVQGKVIAVAAGARSAYALTDDGTVYVWGGNNMGQLGLGTETGRKAVVGTPTPIPQEKFGGSKVKQIVCTELSAYALTEGGEVYAWGDNDYGQLGTGNDDTGYFTAVPEKLALTGMEKLSARSTNVMALSNGKAYVWGQNNFYQLGLGGDGERKFSSVPTVIELYYSLTGEEESVTAKDILCGGITNFVISEEGNVYSFGSAGDGQAGFPLDAASANANLNLNNMTRPAKITFYQPRSIYDITVNNIEEFMSSSPVDTSSPISLRVTRGVGSSGNRTFVADENGKVWSWGNNTNGLTASGDVTNCTAPVRATLYRNADYDKTVKTKNYMVKPAVMLIIIFGLGAAGLIWLEIKTRIGRKRALAENKKLEAEKAKPTI